MLKKVISYLVAMSLVFMMVIVPQVSVYAASVSNDTANKVVTMTGSNYKMIFNYNAKAKITSFVVNGRETLDAAGMYSAVKNNGTWVTTESLTASPTVSVSGSVVTATLSTSVANETWIFTCSDANVTLKLSRTYNGAYTVNMQGTPMIHWTQSLFENIRWKDSAGNMPIGGRGNNYGRWDHKWIVAGENLNTNIAVGQEQVSFSMLSSDANATALKVDTTTNHDNLDRGRTTQLRRTSNGALQMAIETSASNMTYATGSAPWGYTSGNNLAWDMLGIGRSDGGDIFNNVNVTNGQNDTVTMVFSPDTYSTYYDIGTLKGVNQNEISHIINDIGRFAVMDKRMGGFFGCAQTKSAILNAEQQWMSQVFSLFPGNNTNAINSQKSSLDLMRQYCIKSDGNCFGSTPGDAVQMSWGSDYPDMHTGYLLGAINDYYLTGDLAWLQNMKPSMESVLSYVLTNFCDSSHYYFVKNHYLESTSTVNCYWEMSRGTYCSYCTAHLYDALVRYAQLERNVLNDTAKASQYETIAATIKANYSRNISDGGFWSTDTNSVLMGTGNRDVLYMPAQAEALKVNIISDDKKRAIVDGMESDAAYYNEKFHPFNYTAIQPWIDGYAQYAPGGEDGGWYPCMEGELYAGFPVMRDRNLLQKYITDYLNISATGNGFFSSGSYARDGVTDVGFERWFTSQVMPIWGLYTYGYGFQPQYNELVLAPFISPDMVGSVVKYTWRGQTISVTYNSLYSYSINAGSLPTNIRVRFINQDPNTSYTVNVDGTNNSVTSDSNGNVEAVMSTTGTHSYTLSNPKAEDSVPAGYTYCADDNGTYALNGACDVAYGANGKFNYMYGKTGSITFNSTTFGGDPISGIAKKGYYKISPGIPTGYTYGANENGTYALNGTCDVAYGANGQFKFLYNKTNTITFNNATFGGDPIPGVAKKGYYKKVTSSAINKTGWTVSASQSDASFPAINAKDGNLTTKWSTGQPQTNGQSFTIDMGSSQYITRLLLNSSNGDYPRGYQVFVSNDGTNWGSAVASGVGKSDDIDIIFDISCSSPNGRYIKIVQTGSDPIHWWSINEANVFGFAGGMNSNSYFKIVNRTSGKVLDNGGTSNLGAQLQQWTDNAANNTNQQWKIVDLGNGYYKIVNRTSNMALDLPNGSINDGTILQQYTDQASTNNNQQWIVKDLKSGYYTITSRVSGKVFDNSGGSTADGNKIQQWTDNTMSNYNQQWQIIRVQ
ncbi:MAG TPA: RICIN domain-containing protein [Ruminiclostridium sp.]